MAPQTPYAHCLGDLDPIAAMPETVARIRTLVESWSHAELERTYAPGKWSARQIIVHLAETELALGYRVRMALAAPAYTAQPFEQDAWMARDEAARAAEALDALVALSAMNVRLFASLPPNDRATPFAHPEYGELTVDWLIHQIAGHQIHHLAQLERIAKGVSRLNQ
jgi:uncharacterized damage-inducible protein DinB